MIIIRDCLTVPLTAGTVFYKHLLEVRKLKIGIQETRNPGLVNTTYNDYQSGKFLRHLCFKNLLHRI